MHTILCITTCIAALVTSSFANKGKKKGDIEEFIDRLLTSDKFDQLAEKIAEKAADKIIYLQRQEELTHNTNHSAKHNSKHKIKKHEKEDSDKTLQTKYTTTNDNKKPKKEKADESEPINDEKKPKKEKNDESEPEEIQIQQRAKIDNIAIKQKFSVFPQENLSLKYNQFTTTVSKPTTSVLMSSIFKTEENVKDHVESDHKNKHHNKKHTQNQELDEIINKKKHLPKKLKKKIENSDVSKETDEKEKKKDEHNNNSKYPSFRSKAENNEKLSESYSSESDVSVSDSNEAGYSSTNHNNHGESKANFGLVDPDKSSKEEIESNSFENEVSITTEPANFNKNTKADLKTNTVNLMDKIREQNGKKYAFAQSFEYEEYHEKLSKLLDKVKNKSVKPNSVNKDLLDLLQ